ncbi:MAG TPA: fatty acid cis/trans isomerase [Myxococcota bacterium]|nr:fatty acid cis/trans isomerase [Myxococcota bacterium]
MIRTATSLKLLIAAPLLLGMTCAQPPPVELASLPGPTQGEPVSYLEDVKPVLESRCVVCHGCYDAPCQLLMSSYDGLDRGATKLPVYHSTRLIDVAPTRLHVDASDTQEWRERGFYSVLEEADAYGYGSLLLNMIALGRSRPTTPDARLPDDFPLELDRELSCPTASEFEGYAREHPLGGMPYGMAPLSDREIEVLVAWIRQGAPAPPPEPPLAGIALEQIRLWEAFLNGSTLKERIAARYLYEHWFLAHLAFDALPDGPFFRLARSSTPPGEPVQEIATRRPYDDPGVERVWYRLIPLDSTVLHKSHMSYALSDAKRARLAELFLETDWNPTELPVYHVSEASNPFATFREIPARSRYQFLLDDAQYFFRTFIRGPVCHGRVAVSVIEDHFFIAFLDPDSDMSIIDAAFLEEAEDLLGLPAEGEGEIGGIWLKYNLDQRRYLDVRERYYDKLDPNLLGPTLDAVWDGDGGNSNALLTVFRHFDNAEVVRGFVGAYPKTAWIVDFPLFERIYYDLVANFDVFGNVAHQISTRLYMDHLRMQSENLFLAFVPVYRREAVRESWYAGAEGDRSYRVNAIRSNHHATQIKFKTRDVTRELLQMIAERNPAVTGPADRLNRCERPPCDAPDATAVERRAERALQPLAGVTGRWVAELPELSFLIVRSGRAPEADASYSLAHNRAHTNVAAMFDEDERLVPEDDTLTIARGYLGSYPNFVFEVPIDEIEAFASALRAVGGATDFEALVSRWGVRRTSPRFWGAVDWIHEDDRRRNPSEAGIFDFGRYLNL